MIATLLLAASAILPADSFVKGENGVWSCDLSGIGISITPGEYHSGGWTNVPRHPSLYFGSAPMTLAREPEEGSWFTFEMEFPFANANGAVVTPEKCRAFGRDIALALRGLMDGQ